MKKKSLAGLIEALMRCPAAPYFEDLPMKAVTQICKKNGLRVHKDRFGNLLIGNAKPEAVRMLMVAHLDHPGFRILSKEGKGVFKAEFLGGVPPEYFKKGLSLRLFPGNEPATIGRRIEDQTMQFEIKTLRKVESASFAVWDLIPFVLKKGLVKGRACDDLVGAGSALAVLIDLKGEPAAKYTSVLLTRAEEVGFGGTLAAGKTGEISKEALVVSLETSRELPPVKMGEGVILRVGDRASIFDPRASRFFHELALGLAEKKKKFHYQRALMSGGTCEGTAWQEYGYTVAALCVALGNYHNCGRNEEIRAEFVDLADVKAMVLLLTEGARTMAARLAKPSSLHVRLEKLASEATPQLLNRVP